MPLLSKVALIPPRRHSHSHLSHTIIVGAIVFKRWNSTTGVTFSLETDVDYSLRACNEWRRRLSAVVHMDGRCVFHSVCYIRTSSVLTGCKVNQVQ